MIAPCGNVLVSSGQFRTGIMHQKNRDFLGIGSDKAIRGNQAQALYFTAPDKPDYQALNRSEVDAHPVIFAH
jgi:hypothetical protein